MPTRIRLLERVVEVDARFDPDGLLELLYRHLRTTEPADARLELERLGGRDRALVLAGVGGGGSDVGGGGGGASALPEVRRALEPGADPLAEAHRLLLESTLGAARGAIVLHAGAVAAGGRALLILGESWAGKTTLVEALCERGLELLSDDYAPLRCSDLRVIPFPRAIGRRPAGATPVAPPLRSRRWIDPLTLAKLALDPLPVGAIVVLATAGPGSPPARLRPLPATQTLAHLLAAVRNPEAPAAAPDLEAGTVPAAFVERLAALAARVPAAALVRGPVAEMARAAASLF